MNKITIRRTDEIKGAYGSVKLYVDKKEVANLKKNEEIILELENGEYEMFARNLIIGKSKKYLLIVNNEDKEIVYGTYKERLKKSLKGFIPAIILFTVSDPILQMVIVTILMAYFYTFMYQIKEVEPKI